ncbi:hypothetical protein FJQ98_01855 [Lysinibacillus agricola]|uniref:Uncharacterized protein n=1 Tax=Lysinibacillus agricola TaxID=2590012 RepID=A0ABX7AXD6_9BACI|nr:MULTISPECIES: hypothetical protein [Lysinibacillus]KOS61297.1 hypothetical protein AN161_18645 [Lysinibacillus sp. FJAT-14222]QQP12859.1 hypothetical protein FJQ98_01855 [Lysinibacillus agricola]
MKFKKIVLASALALSTLTVMPVSETQKASAAGLDWWEFCKSDDLCQGVTNSNMMVGTENRWGATKLEIKSGAGVVTLTSRNTIKAMKPGEAIVYHYDRTGATETGKYYIYKILVK